MEILLESYTVSIILFSLLIILILGSSLMVLSNKIAKDRISSITSHFKFLIGSIILVFITTIINKGLEERQLALQESQQLEKQIKRLKELSTGKEIENVEYFATLSRSSSARTRWKNYLETLKNREKKELLKKKSQDFIKSQIKKEKEIKVEELSKTISSVDSLETKTTKLNEYERKELRNLKIKLKKQEEEISTLEAENAKVKLISYNISNDLKRPKEELFSDGLLICNNLLKPLDSILTISKDVYNNQYKANGFLYKDAKKLNNLNLTILKLLNENIALFPNNLREDFDLFIDYLERWTNAFLI